MLYSLVNLDGKTLESFRDDSVARKALRAAVEADPRLTSELMILQNDDATGEPVGRAIMYEDLADAQVVPAITSAAIRALTEVSMTAARGYSVIQRIHGPAREVYAVGEALVAPAKADTEAPGLV